MELYESIEDFPIYNWFKCIDTKDYSYCLVKKKECNEKELAKCTEAFGLMYAQYLDKFGISDQLMEILNLQNQILVHKIDMADTGDLSIQTFIEIKEIELNKRLQTKEAKTNTHKVAIEKYLGFQIKEKETSVVDYYNYLEAIKEEHGRATD